ncbi:hypothetical protein BCON_0523g00010 [Botryotinia convoluta]|uniref:Uncharacterized protein n=1 Tax=Botryotinia convoluta TaxID=54673 RepID=A0A4Z1H5F2_9HELO|nr:hypothetical protein BCON_0523g00010 [Botryotinia convoluta]
MGIHAELEALEPPSTTAATVEIHYSHEVPEILLSLLNSFFSSDLLTFFTRPTSSCLFETRTLSPISSPTILSSSRLLFSWPHPGANDHMVIEHEKS